MFNRQLRANIKEIDLQIGKLSKELVNCVGEELEMNVQRIEELTKIRGLLTDSKVKDSSKGFIIPGVISGAFGIGATLLVLYYEKDDIVTSKSFGIATKLFK